MACVNQTRPHYVNQMGTTQFNDLTERQGRGTAGEQPGNGRGTAGERHGNGMVRVNPPLLAWTGPEGSRKLKPPDMMTIGI
jgi:hypothetical protein